MINSSAEKTLKNNTLTTANHTAGNNGRSLPAVPVFQNKVIESKSNTPVVQRAPKPLLDKSFVDKDSSEIGGAFDAFHVGHALGNNAGEYDKDTKKYEDLTEDNITEIAGGVFVMTEVADAVHCNCFGWALGLDQDTGDKGKLYNWKEDHGGEENFTDPDAGGAKIMLWGNKDKGLVNKMVDGKKVKVEVEGEQYWDVKHASVKLSHAELVDRSGNYHGFNVTDKELKDAKIPDPCWSSAGGMGYGIIVHPREWYEGGTFGEALKGMKGPG